jgi:hypothetical protein
MICDGNRNYGETGLGRAIAEIENVQVSWEKVL